MIDISIMSKVIAYFTMGWEWAEKSHPRVAFNLVEAAGIEPASDDPLPSALHA